MSWHPMSDQEIREYLAPRYDDELIERVYDFIWEYMAHPITVEKLDAFANMADLIVEFAEEYPGENDEPLDAPASPDLKDTPR